MKNTQRNQKRFCTLPLWAPVNVPDARGLHATCLPPGDLALVAVHHPRSGSTVGQGWSGDVVMGGEGVLTRS